MSLASVTDIFPNATIVAGELRIPSGDIVSYNPSTVSSPAGSEMVYGLLETISQAVEAADYTNVKVTSSSSLTTDSVLRRLYTFTINLDFTSSVLEDLNVKSEPS